MHNETGSKDVSIFYSNLKSPQYCLLIFQSLIFLCLDQRFKRIQAVFFFAQMFLYGDIPHRSETFHIRSSNNWNMPISRNLNSYTLNVQELNRSTQIFMSLLLFHQRQERKEENVSSYCLNLKRRENTGTRKTQQITLSGELVSEETTDLS